MIGDAFVSADTNHVAALTVWDADGQSGLGFFDALFAPLPPRAWLTAHIAATIWPALDGRSPEGLLHRVVLPRDGHGTAPPFGIADALDQALWDLAAKRARQPLWRYLGGTSGEADAYASGLCFHLTNTTRTPFTPPRAPKATAPTRSSSASPTSRATSPAWHWYATRSAPTAC